MRKAEVAPTPPLLVTPIAGVCRNRSVREMLPLAWISSRFRIETELPTFFIGIGTRFATITISSKDEVWFWAKLNELQSIKMEQLIMPIERNLKS